MRRLIVGTAVAVSLVMAASAMAILPAKRSKFNGVTSEHAINGYRPTVSFTAPAGGSDAQQLRLRDARLLRLGPVRRRRRPLHREPVARDEDPRQRGRRVRGEGQAGRELDRRRDDDRNDQRLVHERDHGGREDHVLAGAERCRLRPPDGEVHRDDRPPAVVVTLSLPAYVRCPACRGNLGDDLVCASCGRSTELADGIARLLDPTAPGLDAKLRELAAWPVLAREQGWYDADDRIDAALPFLNRDLGWNDRAWGATSTASSCCSTAM